jgi:prepilin-type N-terminal cleavage/methylation domain-containing protein
MNYNLNNEAGFTMIELLIAISILGVVLLPLTDMLIDNTSKVIEAKQMTIAINLARLKLEEQRVKAFEDISSIALTEMDEESFNNYRYSVEVNNIKTKVKKVVVKVYFKENIKAELLTFIRDM